VSHIEYLRRRLVASGRVVTCEGFPLFPGLFRIDGGVELTESQFVQVAEEMLRATDTPPPAPER
jgi:hypothetical protein